MTKNLTVGNPVLLILSFAIPLFIGNAFQLFYSMADAFIVGRTVGVAALAAVGATGSLVFLILGFLMGFTQGAAIITSQRFGRGDSEGVRRSFAASLILGLMFTALLMLVSLLTAKPLLVLLGTPEEIFDGALGYIIVIYWGIPAAMLFNLFSNTMRSVGDSRTPLLFLVIACLVNIVLDFVFILLFHTGVEGAAWATVLSELASALLCIPVIIKKIPILKIRRSDWRPALGELGEHLRLAFPAGFQMSIIAIGTAAVSYALNRLGTAAVAAFTAAAKIDQAAAMMFISLGAALTTFTAQNYGAGKIERIRRGIFQSLGMAAFYSLAMGLLFFFFGRFFSFLFLGSVADEILSMSHTYLIINSIFYLVDAMMFIFRQTLQGLGDSLTPTSAGIVELVLRTFAAVILGRYFGFTGISFASPLAWSGAVIPLVIALVLSMRRLGKEARPAL